MEDYLSILKEFEESKDRFSYEAIRSKLNGIHEHYPDLNSEYWSESLAFSFSENQQNNPEGYKAYYGPMLTVNSKNGTKVSLPPFESINSDRLAYWEKRSNETAHPYLKLRYLGLVIEFKKRIAEERINLKQFEDYVYIALKIIDEGFIARSWEIFDYLNRCLSISIKINSEKLREEVKSRYLSLNSDDSPASFYRPYDDLLWNTGAKLSEDERKNIIGKIDEAIDQMSSDVVEKIDPEFLYEGVKRLSEFYNRTNDKAKLGKALLNYRSSIEKLASKLPAIVIVQYWERLLTLYSKYGFIAEAKQVVKEIEKRSPELLADMKRIGTNFEIPIEFINGQKEVLSQMPDQDALINFAECFIPNMKRESEALNERKSEFPLLYGLSKDSLDGNTGRKIAQIGSVEEDFEGQLTGAVSQTMVIYSPLLREILEFLINSKNIKTESILQFLNESPIFPKDRSEFIGRSIEYFKKKEYDTFVHNIIPQIEHALRELLGILGGSTMKAKEEIYNLKNLDEILRDPLILNFLGQDLSEYLRILLTDNRGWNLRNNVMHGISSPDSISSAIADRVFHALLCLGLFSSEESFQ
ncbi:DUF4209 domain-containing protein [Leptospira stimsonii]|uniref:DUF4209 domain-containing protein n=1 Tax=Leptospira stimsonii TaxID=2202203 RepID=A0ABY2N4Q2_9LEPT|nr:DUF4209 domain-containing protein [Leptospira stimsonii]TGK12928.1 DUF4209 domain-containing protein [Leptospira stimsonii]TGM16915.1 DUF4209 domain-containing protein [Leptospira stimsonii]